MKKLLFTLLFTLCIASFGYAEENKYKYNYNSANVARRAVDVISRQELVAAAASTNPEYLAAVEDAKSARYNRFSSYSDYLPSVDLRYSYNDSRSREVKSESHAYTAYGSLNLFNGFRSYTNTRVANFNYRAARYSRDEALLGIVKDVNIAYQAALKSAYLMSAAMSSFESADLMLKESEQRLQLDIIARADLYKARADREKANSSYLDAQVNYAVSLLELTKLSGIELDEMTVLKGENRFFALGDLDVYINLALNNNFNIQKSEINADIAERNVHSAAGAFLPSVDLTLSSTWNDPKRGSSYNSNQVGVTASWNIFNGFYDTTQTLAKLRSLSSTRLKLVDSRNILMKEVKNLWMSANISYEKVESAKLYRAAAEESYISTQEMYRLGRVSLQETVDARATLEDAQATLADAEYQMIKTYEDLYFITGGTFEFDNGLLDTEYGFEAFGDR